MKNWFLAKYLFVILLGQMHENMQKNHNLNGKTCQWATSTPFSKVAFFCTSGIVLFIFQRVLIIDDKTKVFSNGVS